MCAVSFEEDEKKIPNSPKETKLMRSWVDGEEETPNRDIYPNF